MQYYGQLNLDWVIHNKYFLNKTHGSFIECGAFDGVIDSNTLFFYKNLNWTGFNIEPVPHVYYHLNNNRPRDINLNMALSDSDGVKTFTQALANDVPYYGGHFGNGSLEHTKQHIQELNNRGCRYEEYQVKTITLPTLYEKYQINKQIDLFILDVEGHEGKVLSQLHKIQKSLMPKIIATEYGHCGEEEINKFLLPLGYTMDYKDAINLVFKLD
jgi:FkbM family methyltransferase